MPDGTAFDAEILARLDAAQEIAIETRRASGAPRRTVIWIMVDGSNVYVRSVRGQDGRWYQDLLARPDGAVHIDSDRIPISALAAGDPFTVSRVSDLIEAKYGSRHRASTVAMLRAHTLPTTLRLQPV